MIDSLRTCNTRLGRHPHTHAPPQSSPPGFRLGNSGKQGTAAVRVTLVLAVFPASSAQPLPTSPLGPRADIPANKASTGRQHSHTAPTLQAQVTSSCLLGRQIPLGKVAAVVAAPSRQARPQTPCSGTPVTLHNDEHTHKHARTHTHAHCKPRTPLSRTRRVETAPRRPSPSRLGLRDVM